MTVYNLKDNSDDYLVAYLSVGINNSLNIYF